MSQEHNDEEAPLLLEQHLDEDNKLKGFNFYLIIACILSTQFIASVDSTMVVTLMGKISSEYESQQHISWIATSYLLSCAAMQPLFGKLSDIFGRKLCLVLCQIIFGAGCLACAKSTSLNMLIWSRLVTGIGGGGMQTLSSICISDLVKVKERGLFQGYVSISWQMGVISGGLIAGLFDKLWGWKSAFFVQVPYILLIASLVWFYFDSPIDRKLKSVRISEKLEQIDWMGSVLLVTSLLSIMFLFGTSDEEIPALCPVWYFLTAYSIVGFGSFYVWEKRHPSPIIPVQLLHHKNIFWTCINSLCSQINFYSCLFYMPFYWTSVQNHSPFESGYRLIPSTVVACSTSVTIGFLIKHTGRYRRIHKFGGFMLVIGSIIVFTQSQSYGVILESVLSLPLRMGTSTNFNVMIVTMLSSVSEGEQALISSIHYGVKSTGSTIGVSLANVAMQTSLKYILHRKFDLLQTPDGWDKSQLTKALTMALNDPNYAFKAGIPPSVKQAIVDSYDSACHCVYALMILMALMINVCIWHTDENDLDPTNKP